MLFILL